MKLIYPILVLATVLCFGALPSKVSAGAVEYSAGGNYLLSVAYNSTASTVATRLPVGVSVELGTFAVGFNFTSNRVSYTDTNAGFTLYNTTTVGVGTNNNNTAGQFDKNDPNLGTTVASGTRLYMWVFNNAIPSSATAWAIVTNPTWTAPTNDAAGFIAIDTSDPGTVIAAGALGAVVGDTAAVALNAGATYSIQVNAVPEPSTYAVDLLGCIGLVIMAKCRKVMALV